MKINQNYANVKKSYLFIEIAHRLREYVAAHPDADIIKMGIGDVTLPLAPAVVEAMRKAADEMGKKETFRGYVDDNGYDFLINAVKNYYANFGVDLDYWEIFISDGAKSDLGNILDLFDADNTVLVTDPVYPVYVDTNVMSGRRVIFADATEENGFLPLPDPSVKADIIYLCTPNNPTGAAYTRAQLKQWVDYAKAQGAVILFDSAYEIEGARDCVIEFCSLSKTAGFTGTRCGYTVVPKTLKAEGDLNGMWLRRQTTKFNGVAYVIQRAAEAVFTPEGQRQIKENIAYYQENAKILMSGLDRCGIKYFGGKNSPYIWLKCPDGMGSWEFFDKLLSEANVVGTPGEGFGKNGKGYFRLTSFSTHEKTAEAVERIYKMLRG